MRAHRLPRQMASSILLALAGLACAIPVRANSEVVSAVRVPARAVRFQRIPALRSALCCHVSVVLGASPQEQMIGPNAGSHVTVMQHAQIVWDRPVGQLPRDAVRETHLTIDTDHAVSGLVQRACPRPAAIRVGLIYPRPESLGERSHVFHTSLT